MTANYLAIIVSTIVMMGVGYVWYGPLFGKMWRNLMGSSMDATKANSMAKSYGLMALGALVLSLVMEHNLTSSTAYAGMSDMAAGFQVAIWNWLGFVVPVSMGSVIWEGKPWKLWMINAGYYLVGMILVGILLALWI